MLIEYPPSEIRSRLVYWGQGIVKALNHNLHDQTAMIYQDPFDLDHVYAQFDSMDLFPYCFGLSKFKTDIFKMVKS